MKKKKSSPSPPPWQVLDLIAHRLNPKTLATAACVSKSWYISMSSDHLWHPICSAAFPYLSHLHLMAAPPTPFHKLYSLGRVAEHRRLKKPEKPRLRMHDLTFAIHVRNGRGCIASVVHDGGGLKMDKNEIFRFDMDVEEGDGELVVVEELDELRVTWNVVLGGMRGVFTMMDCGGKGSFVLGLEGWFSKELPATGCCGGGGSGLVADLRLGLREGGGGKVVVEKVSVGVLSVVNWRSEQSMKLSEVGDLIQGTPTTIARSIPGRP